MRFLTLLTYFLTICVSADLFASSDKIVIAHRGASGYLPEHTLEAKAMAYAMGADYIEQDVVLTKDNIPVVLHDIRVDTVTDVAKKFPDRKRKDGRYYAIDFTLGELKTLRVCERLDDKTFKIKYPGRFPRCISKFEIPTLAEELQLIKGLNKSTGKNVGAYVEIKKPFWHKKEKKDISPIVLDTLKKHGYFDKKQKVFLQCFDAEELKRIKHKLGSKLPLVQLIGENSWKEAPTDYDLLKTKKGLKNIATYAVGIGPYAKQIANLKDGKLVTTKMVKNAHEYGLLVHPYTFRADDFPAAIGSFEDLLKLFLITLDVDGLFTDFPDKARLFLSKPQQL